jgi:AraC-like DNA-binding protein
MQDSVTTQVFNEQRKPYTPYGTTCEMWKPSLMNRPDYHNEIELNLLKHGSLTYLLRGRRVTVWSGRLTLFWALVPHQIVQYDGDAPYFVATVPLSHFLQWKLPPEFVNAIVHGEVIDEGNEAMYQGDLCRFTQWFQDANDGSQATEEIMLMEMEARLHRLATSYSATWPDKATPARLDKGTSDHVEQMAVFVAANYQQQLLVKDIADSVGLHPDYATSLFQRAFGMSLYEYLLDHRISHAQRMLATSVEKIASIAFDSGFNSNSRFNAAFKQTCNCTPSEFRKRHKMA